MHRPAMMALSVLALVAQTLALLAISLAPASAAPGELEPDDLLVADPAADVVSVVRGPDAWTLATIASPHDVAGTRSGTVVVGTEDGLVELTASGSVVRQIDDGGAVNRVAVGPDGTIYATFRDYGLVRAYDPIRGTFELATGLGTPRSLSVARSGVVLVTDDAGLRRYAGDGTLIRSEPGAAAARGAVELPSGEVEVDPGADLDLDSLDRLVRAPSDHVGIGMVPTFAPAAAAGQVFAADPQGHRVLTFPPAGGVGTTVGQGLRTPNGVAVDDAGNVYIADAPLGVFDPDDPPTGRLVQVSADGRTQTVLADDLANPWGVATDGAGHVYVSEYTVGGSVLRFETDGSAPPAEVDSGAVYPTGLGTDPLGNLYVADFLDGVLRVAPDGTVSAVPGSPSLLWDVAVDATGGLVASSFVSSRVWSAEAGGSYGPELDAAYGLAHDAAGALLVADPGVGQLRRILPDGTEAPSYGAVDFELGDPVRPGSPYLTYRAPYDVAVFAPPPRIDATTAPAAGKVGVGYSHTWGTLPAGESATFRVADGALPDGLSLSSAGVLSGTPTTAGTFTFRVSAGNAARATVGAVNTVTIAPRVPPAVAFTSAPPRSPVVGQTYVPTVTGGELAASGSCSIADGTVTFDHVGTCRIVASSTSPDGTGTASQSVEVSPAQTRTRVALQRDAVIATVSVLAPGGGVPAGEVVFSDRGEEIGTVELSVGARGDVVAVLTGVLEAGSPHEVTATYAGSADHLASSGSVDRTDPAVTADLTSRIGPTRFGWYRSPVRVSFTCEVGTAPLVGGCPGPLHLSDNRRGLQPITVGVTAEDGGAALVEVTVRIDRTDPTIRVRGAKDGRTYDRVRALRCTGRDPLSGIAGCRVSTTRTGDTVSYRAVARDRAGNRTVVRGRYFLR